MKGIIRFDEYKRGAKTMEQIIERLSLRFPGLIEELVENKRNQYVYSLDEIDNIANQILDNVNYYSPRGATPIVKISKEFGFVTYKEKMFKLLSGDIKVNGDTYDKYKHNQIILVNKLDVLKHQRFVIAHELAHFLFDFLGNPMYEDSSILFSEKYYKDCHNTESEVVANRFAAALLMPEKVFIEQYFIAKNEEDNIDFIVNYLSEFFETTVESIIKRIKEVLG